MQYDWFIMSHFMSHIYYSESDLSESYPKTYFFKYYSKKKSSDIFSMTFLEWIVFYLVPAFSSVKRDRIDRTCRHLVDMLPSHGEDQFQLVDLDILGFWSRDILFSEEIIFLIKDIHTGENSPWWVLTQNFWRITKMTVNFLSERQFFQNDRCTAKITVNLLTKTTVSSPPKWPLFIEFSGHFGLK